MACWSRHSLHAVCCMCHMSHSVEVAERNHSPVLQSCPDAIEDVFDSKLHIVGGVGITIGIILVCLGLFRFF